MPDEMPDENRLFLGVLRDLGGDSKFPGVIQNPPTNYPQSLWPFRFWLLLLTSDL